MHGPVCREWSPGADEIDQKNRHDELEPKYHSGHRPNESMNQGGHTNKKYIYGSKAKS